MVEHVLADRPVLRDPVFLPCGAALCLMNEHLAFRLGGDLDIFLLDHAHSAARLALAGTVALFAQWPLYVQELQGDRIAELGKACTLAR
jgi:hypothetical protein